MYGLYVRKLNSRTRTCFRHMHTEQKGIHNKCVLAWSETLKITIKKEAKKIGYYIVPVGVYMEWRYIPIYIQYTYIQATTIKRPIVLFYCLEIVD